jgi:adenylate cyclase
MSRSSLKTILNKNPEVAELIDFLKGHSATGIHIKDKEGNSVFGQPVTNPFEKFEIKTEDEIEGWVEGDQRAATIAGLLSLLIKKENERKKLGTEVLNLYQEVNLIFNVSEKLAQAIEPSTIAQIILDEAGHVIKSSNGVVILWDEHIKGLQVLARSGSSLFNEPALKINAGLLLKIGKSGNSEIISDISILKNAGIIGENVKSLLYAALKVKHRIMGAIILANTTDEQYSAADLKLLVTLALQSSAAIESALLYERNIREAKEKEEAMRRIYVAAGKFVPFEFISSLGRDVITDVRLGDQVEKSVTVLFSDIRDYTSLSEQMTPDENFSFICSFNEKMGPVIRTHKGFINQYQGDAIMAIFPNHAADALTAAIEMQKTVEKFNKTRINQSRATIKMGIGLHTGPLIMGITGDNERMAPTTISDTVNTASRIESLTKYYKASIILTDSTLQQITHPEDFHLRCLGKVQVKGKQAPVVIHECFSGNSEEEIAKKEKSLPAFNKGMSRYLDKSFSDAIESFNKVISSHPEDRTTEFFIEKARRYIKNGVPENWAGVEEMLNK